jgi:hypothetical protein
MAYIIENKQGSVNRILRNSLKMQVFPEQFVLVHRKIKVFQGIFPPIPGL